MKIKLHPIKHDLRTTLWCGPAALAILSGKPTSTIREIFRKHTGRELIKGVSYSALREAARTLGFDLVPVTSVWENSCPTLRQWTKANRDALSENTFILNAGHHYVVVQGRRFVDNWTKVPVPLGKAPKPRRRVRFAWKVVQVNSNPELSAFKPAPKLEDPYRKERKEAKALATKCRIQIEEGNFPGEFWVYPPDGLYLTEETDPYESISHYAFDWSDVLRRVKKYASDYEQTLSHD